MANFDLSYYNGDDGYSDGDAIENYIYDVVRAGKGLDDIPESEITWPVFYHLSPVRESICNWYPFKKNASILEIGSGCGAITGVLCQNAERVTSVELSKKRASINYERNKDYQNLDIIVGNLNDIKFEQQYDYITLIGVLEYAGRFTEGEKPFHVFLSNIKKMLKPDGAILIAIENRLGLKYFSGAPEDHTGRLFDGINDYQNYTGVRTFSKSELIELVEDCGFKYNRFYYPYPDYKLPQEIFTDCSIGRIKKPYNTYDVDRYSLFDETNLNNTLQKENVASVFSNSFFVEIRENNECDTSVLYAKLNQDRKEEFRIGTVIHERNGEKLVEKKSFHPMAVGYINRLFENNSKVYGKANVLAGKRLNDCIEYSLIDCETLADIIKKLIRHGEVSEIIKLLSDFFDALFSDAVNKCFQSENFANVFGHSSIEMAEVKCVYPANIDISPNNVFCSEKEYFISDFEWVFDFYVPVSFIIWRFVRLLYSCIPQLSNAISEAALLDRLNVTESNIDVFKAWEKHFVDEYVLSKGRGIPKSVWNKQIIYGAEEKLAQEAQQYEEQLETYRDEISKIKQENERLQSRHDADEREIRRLKERVNGFVLRTYSTQKILSDLAKSKAFKLIHLHKRTKEQLIRGNQEDKREYFKWVKSRNATRQNSDISYNYLLQLEAAIQGDGNNTPEIIESETKISVINAKRIDIITPGHTLFLAKQIIRYLNDSGIDSEIHDPSFTQYEQIPYIVICANIMPQLPPCYICYQMEQTINSRWLSERYIEILDHSEAVLDYSRLNEEYFAEYSGLRDKIYYIPMGVSTEDIKDCIMPDKQDIDVLFYGDLNCDRRKRILAELEKTFKVFTESDLFGEKMHDLIRRAKVVVNIHYYEGALLETPRIAEVLSLGTSVIVSERSSDQEEEKRIDGLIDFVDLDDVDMMKKRITYWLDNSDARQKKLKDNKEIIQTGRVDSKEYFYRFLQVRGIIDKS